MDSQPRDLGSTRLRRLASEREKEIPDKEFPTVTYKNITLHAETLSRQTLKAFSSCLLKTESSSIHIYGFIRIIFYDIFLTK